MDIGLWNAVGITVMAIFGLWAFSRSGNGAQKRNKK